MQRKMYITISYEMIRNTVNANVNIIYYIDCWQVVVKKCISKYFYIFLMRIQLQMYDVFINAAYGTNI